MLRTHRQQQIQERLTMGEVRTDSGFVFTQPEGSRLHPQHVSDQFLWLAYLAGLPPIRLHDLRHGAASLMLVAGVEMKVVQETLGHTSSAFTTDTYTSVYPQAATAAAEKTAALVFGKEDQARSRRGGAAALPQESEAVNGSWHVQGWCGRAQDR
ncbi:tyrosine-type recombinase/integrase [Nonomuraea phyllanthi]|uniref:Tyrosine-type recombinase/integrase n=1 Tax=Nonomuraea phyllanthi TaxID=2219224 RepID=A0A5C4VML4_9ACTN|nr:site-specific integrase [Nonomuraea phyllanthi]KAB8189533.1 tyrosine-type recombinase/integrase [Nonomuraea phyllanthi]